MKVLMITLLLASAGYLCANEPGSIARQFLNREVGPNGPAVVALVAREGEILFHEAVGFADRGERVRATVETTFYIASLSKPFTAMAILMLEGRGELELGDSLDQFLPDFPSYAEKISLHQLLQHTAGLPDYLDGMESRAAEHDPMGAALDYLAGRKKLNFTPGEKHRYSNSGYLCLAAVVEVVAKQPFPQFLDEAVFVPAGMQDSWVIHRDATERDRTIPSYVGRKDRPSRLVEPADLVYGDGGVMTTARDLHR